MQNQRSKRSVFSNLKNLIAENIITYFKEYLIVTIFFIIGIIIGVIFVNNLSTNQSSEVNTYITVFLDTLKNGFQLEYVELLKNSLLQNLILVLLLWFVGATLIGMPLVFAIIMFRGFCLGYTISALIYVLGISKGILFVILELFLQNIIFIPAIIALAVSGVRLYKTVMKNRNSENIKFAILKHSIFSMLIMLLLIISSVVEVFVSTNLLKLCINFM